MNHYRVTDEIMSKAKESPGVGKYKWAKPFKIRGYSRQRSRKTTFIEEAQVISRGIPGHKYKYYGKDPLKTNSFALNRSLVFSNAPNYSFRQLRKNKEKLKLPKSMIRDENGIIFSLKVGPGFYKSEESFSKTQAVYKNKLKFGKSKERRYIDQILEDKKKIPGVGCYKNLENAIKLASRPHTAKVKSCGGR